MKKLKQLLALTLCLALTLSLAAASATETVVPVTKVNLSHSSLTLLVNGSETLLATVEPANTTQTGVIFSSSEPSIASVDMYGTVTGHTNGYTVIYATSAVDSTRWAACSVTVLGTTNISLNKSNLTLSTGHTEMLEATISPYEMISQGVTFRSSNPNVAVVSNAGGTTSTVTGVGPGTATIYASAADGTMATCNVTVGVLPETIKLSRYSISINTGSTTSLIATVEPVNATVNSITWKTSNSNVATVDNYGNITTWCAGYATITAAVEGTGVSASCSVNVMGVDVTHVPTATPSPTPQPTLAPGATPTTPPNGVTAYVNTPKGSLNLRATASQNGKILTTIPEKGAFTLLEKGSKWCKVWYRGYTGYVMTSFVRFDKELPTTTPLPYWMTPSPTPVVTLAPNSPNGTVAYVNTVKGSLNMRASASSGGKVLRRIPEKAAFTVIQYGATWCYAWYNGTSGYVMTKFVLMGNASPTPKGATATPAPATIVTAAPKPLDGSVAQVSTANGGSLNMRAAADINSTRVRLIPQGAVIDIMQYGKDWCQARYNGSTGYVMTKFLVLGNGVSKSGSTSTSTKAPSATVPVSTSTTKYAQVDTASGGLNLRKGAGAGYTRVTIIPKGAYVILVNEGTAWSEVNYNGVTGYVMSYFLKKL